MAGASATCVFGAYSGTGSVSSPSAWATASRRLIPVGVIDPSVIAGSSGPGYCIVCIPGWNSRPSPVTSTSGTSANVTPAGTKPPTLATRTTTSSAPVG